MLLLDPISNFDSLALVPLFQYQEYAEKGRRTKGLQRRVLGCYLIWVPGVQEIILFSLFVVPSLKKHMWLGPVKYTGY